MLAREVLKRVREIQVRTGRQVADVLAGQYSSVFKGRGIEFDEVRPYVPGDEIRTIDWNVTARMGEPYVKRYVEERQLTLMLMADVSASQEFGSGSKSKREATAELCALLAFSATFNDDKVGLTLFHGGIEQYIPARKGQKHSLRVVREVLAHESQASSVAGRDADRSTARSLRRPSHGKRLLRWLPFGARRGWNAAAGGSASARQSTNIAGAVEFLMSVTKRKAVCFVVSDFFDDDYLRSLRMAARKHDVIAVLITDPRELEMPNVGLLTIVDPETGQTREIDTGSANFRVNLKRQAETRVATLQSEFRSAKIDFIHIDASQSIVDPLAKFFKMRERRRR
ncbi:DUF58 domain-containing protein [Aureliella helgolandensis]|uniref:DUF58 domain-containing protein n=1 Tax=Aureliella helgolandensis TaxID=2527968 RepID=A0A518G6U7_9BACT|nr:DUF58 domain-containing protein [Aureliella helgolandensis]QDV24312.1 hypothetical protein Q31a_26280 [Aureliella helgolandensis]